MRVYEFTHCEVCKKTCDLFEVSRLRRPMVKGRVEDIPIGSAGGGHVLVGTKTEHPPKNMRLSRIALLLIAIPFAWRFGPEVLTAAVGAIPVLGEMISFLTPGSTDISVGFYFQFVISVVVVWLLLWLAFKALG